MKINFFKRCAAVVLTAGVLSTGLVANAAEDGVTVCDDSLANTALETYDDLEWSFLSPLVDPSMYDQYLGAIMDVCFRNDPQAFVALGLGTAEEAALIYHAGLDFDSLLGPEYPEALRNDLYVLMTQLLGSARYAVTGCEPQADGTYQVTIIYEQYQIFQPLMEVYMTAVSDMAETWFTDYDSIPSTDDLTIQLMTAMCNSLRICLGNATYSDPAIATVTIRQQDGIYLPDWEEFSNLVYLMFDTNSVLDMINSDFTLD